MSRNNILTDAWTDDSREFGPLTVHRPTPHRLNVLMRRRNKWTGENPREQTDLEAVNEWLFVLSRSKEELTKLFRVHLPEWEEVLDSFMADHGDVLADFQEYLVGILQSVEAGGVAPAEQGKLGKEVPSHVS